MNYILLILILYAGLQFLPVNSGAAGSVGLDFLNIGVGARAVGMGEAFCAAADDVNAVYWNPSGLSKLKDKEMTFMYDSWFEDINYNFLAYTQPVGENKGAFAVSFYSLNTGSINEYSNNDVFLGTFENNSKMFVLSYSRKTFINLMAGVNLKMIQDRLYDRTAGAGACDLGFLYILENKKNGMSDLNFGLNIQNLGTGISYLKESFVLPVNVKFGILIKGFRTAGLNLSTDFNLPERDFSIGAEYSVFNEFFLRTGYFYSENNAGRGIRFGFGYGIRNMSIDYAFVPYDILGDTHRVSLTWRFISENKILNEQQLSLDQKKEAEEKLKVLKLQAEEHYQKGLDYYQKKNDDAACSEFREAVKLAPEHLAAKKYYNEINSKLTVIRAKESEKYYNAGKIEYSRGNLKGAIVLWEKSLSLNPENDKAIQALKRAKEQLKEK